MMTSAFPRNRMDQTAAPLTIAVGTSALMENALGVNASKMVAAVLTPHRRTQKRRAVGQKEPRTGLASQQGVRSAILVSAIPRNRMEKAVETKMNASRTNVQMVYAQRMVAFLTVAALPTSHLRTDWRNAAGQKVQKAVRTGMASHRGVHSAMMTHAIPRNRMEQIAQTLMIAVGTSALTENAKGVNATLTVAAVLCFHRKTQTRCAAGQKVARTELASRQGVRSAILANVISRRKMEQSVEAEVIASRTSAMMENAIGSITNLLRKRQ